MWGCWGGFSSADSQVTAGPQALVMQHSCILLSSITNCPSFPEQPLGKAKAAVPGGSLTAVPPSAPADGTAVLGPSLPSAPLSGLQQHVRHPSPGHAPNTTAQLPAPCSLCWGIPAVTHSTLRGSCTHCLMSRAAGHPQPTELNR